MKKNLVKKANRKGIKKFLACVENGRIKILPLVIQSKSTPFTFKVKILSRNHLCARQGEMPNLGIKRLGYWKIQSSYDYLAASEVVLLHLRDLEHAKEIWKIFSDLQKKKSPQSPKCFSESYETSVWRRSLLYV